MTVTLRWRWKRSIWFGPRASSKRDEVRQLHHGAVGAAGERRAGAADAQHDLLERFLRCCGRPASARSQTSYWSSPSL